MKRGDMIRHVLLGDELVVDFQKGFRYGGFDYELHDDGVGGNKCRSCRQSNSEYLPVHNYFSDLKSRMAPAATRPPVLWLNMNP